MKKKKKQAREVLSILVSFTTEYIFSQWIDTKYSVLPLWIDIIRCPSEWVNLLGDAVRNGNVEGKSGGTVRECRLSVSFRTLLTPYAENRSID
jgi:hypothetical protein